MEPGAIVRIAEAFFRDKLPFGAVRYEGRKWLSAIEGRIEFRFQCLADGGKPEICCIVLQESGFAGSAGPEKLERFLASTLEPSFEYERSSEEFERPLRRRPSGGRRWPTPRWPRGR